MYFFYIYIYIHIQIYIYIFATPLAWYKCQNSQIAQKCLGRVRKVVAGLRSESPKPVSCTVRNCVLGCFARCETGFARCERLFWNSWPRETKSLLALSLKHFWGFWLFGTCTRPTGSQIYIYIYRHTCMYIYIHLHRCCEVRCWTTFGHFESEVLDQVKQHVLDQAMLAYFYSGFKSKAFI